MADYTYGYGQALADHVVRPVLFLAYSGEMQWRTRAGDEIAARSASRSPRTWPRRRCGPPSTRRGRGSRPCSRPRTGGCRRCAGTSRTRAGLVIASDQESARAYARLLRKISGESPTVVLSDEKAASSKISAFTENDDRWMVAVRMVSEGVDVPRLAVGV